MSHPGESIDEKLAGGLRDLGLTEYELRVYIAILRHPGSRIPQIAMKSGVPQAKVYATVKRLLERGLCEAQLGPVNTYRPLDPASALAPLVTDLERRTRRASEVVSSLEREYLEPEDSLGAREGRIKVFQGRQAVTRNFRELVEHSEESIAIVSRLPLVVRDDDEAMAAALERGVTVRILSEAPEDFDWHSDPTYQRQIDLGIVARSLPVIPLRMGIFDAQVSTLPMDDPAGGAKKLLILEVRNPSLSRGLLAIFDTYWERARPLPLERH